MWIKLTDVNGDLITLNFAHVVSFNPYGTGTHIVTVTAGLTFFVKETIDQIQRKVGIESI
ncbi:hypothetical protein [Phyllobacterium sp.]|jgi:uncharacterized protein YlzI (FlbEa/FlbD family)|uniref:hypothetical protein n=1 Tax=unclassified Phyllobacterium TaxID=2638441 RepID=UPI001AC509E6|nr:hypothetical protein [Phyllobacterium sp.]MBQ9350444.1 hypothetical protein [Phyllobacterium sp.]MCB8828419.1 hypothetical protein [Escherichia coli]MDA4631711.1 hypothetical protein [Escherichia coli]|eukprot:gene28044-33945_t